MRKKYVSMKKGAILISVVLLSAISGFSSIASSEKERPPMTFDVISYMSIPKIMGVFKKQ